MFKYVLACLAAVVFAVTADAQARYRPHYHHHHNHFNFQHRPGVVLYGNFAQYQQFNFALIGYTNLAAVQKTCNLYGFQVVQVNAVSNYVVVRLPQTFQWTNIVTFSRAGHIRFIEPAFRRY